MHEVPDVQRSLMFMQQDICLGEALRKEKQLVCSFFTSPEFSWNGNSGGRSQDEQVAHPTASVIPPAADL